jgi:hypothetical protein
MHPRKKDLEQTLAILNNERKELRSNSLACAAGRALQFQIGF